MRLYDQHKAAFASPYRCLEQFCVFRPTSTSAFLRRRPHVKDIVAPNEHLAQLSFVLSVDPLFCVQELRKSMRTSRFMYASRDCSTPLSSHPHLSLSSTDLPISDSRNGMGVSKASLINDTAYRRRHGGSLLKLYSIIKQFADPFNKFATSSRK